MELGSYFLFLKEQIKDIIIFTRDYELNVFYKKTSRTIYPFA